MQHSGPFADSCKIPHCDTWTLRLWLSGTAVVACELSCPSACRILVPQTGIKPLFPALQGRFLTTGPPGKFRYCNFYKFTAATVHQASLSEPFFQHHLLTLCLCRVWIILAKFQTLHKQKDYNSVKAQRMVGMFQQ